MLDKYAVEGGGGGLGQKLFLLHGPTKDFHQFIVPKSSSMVTVKRLQGLHFHMRFRRLSCLLKSASTVHSERREPN